VGVVTDQCQIVAALAGPLVEPALDVHCTADLEEEFGTCAAGGWGRVQGRAHEVVPGGAVAASGGGGGGSGAGRCGEGGERGVCQPEHVDVARLVFVGERPQQLLLETAQTLRMDRAWDEFQD